MIIFYDFEVFKQDWLVVLVKYPEKEKTIIINNPLELKEYYYKNKDNIFIGYNSRGYDQYIFKGILLEMNPYKISKYIIEDNGNGWDYSKSFNKIKFHNFDIKTTHHSLKELEAFMGHDIKESNVSFKLNRRLTKNEIDDTVKYCEHDVFETVRVFNERKEEFTSQLLLLEAFELGKNYISKTKANLSSEILEAVCNKKQDEFDLKYPDTLKLDKYQHIRDWYDVNKDYEKELKVEVSGVPHVFAWGGLHGALPKHNSKGLILSCDVASLYPALMIEYNYLSRSVKNHNKYTEIRDTRLQLKREKNPKQQPLKIVLNSTYGCMKNKYNAMFDPLMANNVCIAGQLLLLDLIEKLEGYWKLIQTNTDGLIGLVEDEETIIQIKQIAKEWEQRTRLDLEWEEYSEIYQKDVNNYVIINKEGFKSKGQYVKKLNKLDNDLPIVNKALINQLLGKDSIENTINNCSDLLMFQKINKLTYKYANAIQGILLDKPDFTNDLLIFPNEKYLSNYSFLNETCLRTFASLDERDVGVFKIKKEDGSISKIPGTPDKCFIDNSNVLDKKIPSKLDKQWYIDLAYERLMSFIGE